MPQRVEIGRLTAHIVFDVFMAVLLVSGGALVLVAGLEPGANVLAGFLCSAVLFLAAVPFARRTRVRMVADETGLTLVNTFTRQHVTWDEVAGFRRGHPTGFRAPYLHFGDAIYIDLHDGRSTPLPLTMARQPYRNQRDLDARMAQLQAWVGHRSQAPSAPH